MLVRQGSHTDLRLYPDHGMCPLARRGIIGFPRLRLRASDQKTKQGRRGRDWESGCANEIKGEEKETPGTA